MSGYRLDKSKGLYERAVKVIPEGVNSNWLGGPAFKPFPIFMAKGKGSHIWDVDGNEYIDYLLAYGPLLFGHCYPKILEAVREQMENGTLFGAPDELGVETAELFTKMVPNAELLRFTNTGTEATMHALRIARAYTGRDKIIKFEGHYHGAHDYLLGGIDLFAGLGNRPYFVPYGAGIPSSVSESVVIAPWNDARSLETIVKNHYNQIAAIITEPLMFNYGCIMPKEGYLEFMRKLCDDHGIVLILDEVMTGFRLAQGGAQEYFKINGDLMTYAKVIGGGFSLAAVAGKREVMDVVGVEKTFYGGTYNANPISLAAGKAVIMEINQNREKIYGHLYGLSKVLMNGIREILEDAGHKIVLQGPGPGFQFYFTELEEILNARQMVGECDWDKFHRLALSLHKEGVFIHPDNFERQYLSTQHSKKDVKKTLEAFKKVVKEI